MERDDKHNNNSTHVLPDRWGMGRGGLKTDLTLANIDLIDLTFGYMFYKVAALRKFYHRNFGDG